MALSWRGLALRCSLGGSICGQVTFSATRSSHQCLLDLGQGPSVAPLPLLPDTSPRPSAGWKVGVLGQERSQASGSRAGTSALRGQDPFTRAPASPGLSDRLSPASGCWGDATGLG